MYIYILCIYIYIYTCSMFVFHFMSKKYQAKRRFHNRMKTCLEATEDVLFMNIVIRRLRLTVKMMELASTVIVIKLETF